MFMPSLKFHPVSIWKFNSYLTEKWAFITKINGLIEFGNILAVYYENRVKPQKNKMCAKRWNTFFQIDVGGTEYLALAETSCFKNSLYH
jgi:hypothetical protein